MSIQFVPDSYNPNAAAMPKKRKRNESTTGEKKKTKKKQDYEKFIMETIKINEFEPSESMSATKSMITDIAIQNQRKKNCMMMIIPAHVKIY